MGSSDELLAFCATMGPLVAKTARMGAVANAFFNMAALLGFGKDDMFEPYFSAMQ
jgi:hypothetical protein